ncbi:hypothetical protein JCGZ_20954 [Jatropha curcas]|uniref:Uncharacterized protein n=1 Tax=Jatropha curcas TaxID=180498 RepID=A0A067K5C4_JATCU|nr:hypothetical protein JCGZ_20954 [Jatropha curcas]
MTERENGLLSFDLAKRPSFCHQSDQRSEESCLMWLFRRTPQRVATEAVVSGGWRMLSSSCSVRLCQFYETCSEYVFHFGVAWMFSPVDGWKDKLAIERCEDIAGRKDAVFIGRCKDNCFQWRM